MAKKKKEAKKAAAKSADKKPKQDKGKKQEAKKERVVPAPGDVTVSVYDTLKNVATRALPGSTANLLLLNAGDGDEAAPHFSFHAKRFRPPTSGFYKAVIQAGTASLQVLVDAQKGAVYQILGGTGKAGSLGPAVPEGRVTLQNPASGEPTAVRFVFHKAGHGPPTEAPPTEVQWDWEQAADPVTLRVEEGKSAYDMFVSVPVGFTRDDLKVTLREGTLTVWGSRGGWGASRPASDAPGLTFRRRVRLPDDVAEDAISAGLRDGAVLHLRLCKKAHRDAVAFDVAVGDGHSAAGEAARERLDKRLVEVIRGPTVEKIKAMEQHHASAQARRAEMLDAEQKRLHEHDAHVEDVRRRKESLESGPWAGALRRVDSLLSLVETLPVAGAKAGAATAAPAAPKAEKPKKQAEKQQAKPKAEKKPKAAKAGKKPKAAKAEAKPKAAKAEAKPKAAEKKEAPEEEAAAAPAAKSALLEQLEASGYTGSGAASLGGAISGDAGAPEGSFLARVSADGYGNVTASPAAPAAEATLEPRLSLDERVATAFVGVAARVAEAEVAAAEEAGMTVAEGWPGAVWLKRAVAALEGAWLTTTPPLVDAVDASQLGIVGVQLAQALRRWAAATESADEAAVARAATYLLHAMDRSGADVAQQQQEEEPLPWAGQELDAKLVKACVKEGGKKGQDLAGMSDMGGVKFFHCTVEKPDGCMAALERVLEGMNKEVDADAEDRKGGAGHVGKALMSAGKDQVAMIVHVPAELSEQMSATEWAEAILKPMKGEIVATRASGTVVYAVAKGDQDKELFPLKMRDNGINAGFVVLKAKQLVLDDESEDSTNYAELAGVEW